MTERAILVVALIGAATALFIAGHVEEAGTLATVAVVAFFVLDGPTA